MRRCFEFKGIFVNFYLPCLEERVQEREEEVPEENTESNDYTETETVEASEQQGKFLF